jgi:hypothetical protein
MLRALSRGCALDVTLSEKVSSACDGEMAEMAVNRSRRSGRVRMWRAVGKSDTKKLRD